jgi:hypothetical protein
MLTQDPSFDLMNELWSGLPLLRIASNSVNLTPATILNMYMPLRLGSGREIKETLDFTLQKFKLTEGYVFGVMFAD